MRWSPTTEHPTNRRRPRSPSVRGVEFSRELRDDVLAGDITLSVRLWKRPQVKEGGRLDEDTLVYRIELHAVSLED
jgi:hypothetical protein